MSKCRPSSRRSSTSTGSAIGCPRLALRACPAPVTVSSLQPSFARPSTSMTRRPRTSTGCVLVPARCPMRCEKLIPSCPFSPVSLRPSLLAGRDQSDGEAAPLLARLRPCHYDRGSSHSCVRLPLRVFGLALTAAFLPRDAEFAPFMALYHFPPPSPPPSAVEYCSPRSPAAALPAHSGPRSFVTAGPPPSVFDVPALDRSASTSSLDSNDSYPATPDSCAADSPIARPAPVAQSSASYAKPSAAALAGRHRIPSLRALAKPLEAVPRATGAVQQRRQRLASTSPVAQAAGGSFLNRLIRSAADHLGSPSTAASASAHKKAGVARVSLGRTRRPAAEVLIAGAELDSASSSVVVL